MKKILLSLVFTSLIFAGSFAQTTDLNGVTFGFGAGPRYTFDQTYDYSLTTGAAHNLKLQPLNKGGFVIATVLMVKLGKVSTADDNNGLIEQSKKADYLSTNAVTRNSAKAGFGDRLSINLALNLVDVSSNASFNKSIDGGIGLGYFITDNLQLALFYDVTQVAQMRDYIVSEYKDKPVPNGDGTFYNSLSTSDTNLFYNKTISGLSFKLVYSIANQKAAKSTPPAAH